MSRTYKFKSGYSIAVRDDYDPKVYHFVVETWREANPAPEPPFKTHQVRVKGGMKDVKRKNWSDPSFIEARAAWTQAADAHAADFLLSMAIDITSIDQAVLTGMREWASRTGIDVPQDDVRAFVQAVSADGEESRAFFQWLNGLPGPSEALVTRFINMFPESGKISGQNGIDMGRGYSRRAVPRMENSPAGDDQ